MPAPPRRRGAPAALVLAVCALVLALCPLAAAALEPPEEWSLAAGAAHVLDDESTGMAAVEARWAPFRLPDFAARLPVAPALGLRADGHGGTYAYLSFRVDAAAVAAAVSGRGGEPDPARRWRLVGYTGVGHYRPGDDEEGRELGGPVEFRSGLELSRRLGERSWLGLSFDHLSNAVLYDRNPGSESLVLVWSWSP